MQYVGTFTARSEKGRWRLYVYGPKVLGSKSMYAGAIFKVAGNMFEIQKTPEEVVRWLNDRGIESEHLIAEFTRAGFFFPHFKPKLKDGSAFLLVETADGWAIQK